MIYLFDTNAISDLVTGNPLSVTLRFRAMFMRDHAFLLCTPVVFEIRRGFIHRNSNRKMAIFNHEVVPRLIQVEPMAEDWELAAQYWSDARKIGRQLSDVDLLVAAIATRLDAIIVSDDADFDALPVQPENWREST